MTNSSPPLSPEALAASLPCLLKRLNLSAMRSHWSDLESQALQQSWSYRQFLFHLCELELEVRHHNRLKRLLKEAQLPWTKCLADFDFSHCPQLDAQQLRTLAADPSWVQRGDNLLLFGPSGVGKTHLACALARQLIEFDLPVRFLTATSLVQDLMRAKAQLQISALLHRLDRFALLIIDDLGYVRQSEAESSLLFDLIAHRYERRSLLLTSNQPFSEWGEIFANVAMTVAAVDRLVHHAHIIEISAESFRRKQAISRLSSTGQDN